MRSRLSIEVTSDAPAPYSIDVAVDYPERPLDGCLSTDDQQSVRLSLPYPDPPCELNRWLPLVKWLLAIPHYREAKAARNSPSALG